MSMEQGWKRATWHIQRIPVSSWVIIGLFVVVTTMSAVIAANNLTANSDSNVYPYLLQNITEPNQIIVSSKHTNLLKFPFFFMQAILPINFTTYMIETSLLFVTTVFLWVLITIYSIGKNSLKPTLVTASVLMLASPLFNNEIVYSTVRNIDYPVALLFIVVLARFITGDLLGKRIIWNIPVHYLKVAGVCALASVLIAGDMFFFYILAPSVIAMSLFAYLRYPNKPIRHRSIIAAVVATATALLGIALKKVLDIIGLYDIDAKYLTDQKFELSALPIMIKSIIKQTMSLFGISFSEPHFVVTSIYTILALCLVLYGAIRLIRGLRKHPLDSGFLAVIGVVSIGLLVVAAYIASGLAVIKTANGSYVHSDNTRYLTLIPLAAVFVGSYIVARKVVPIPRRMHTYVTVAFVFGITFFVVNAVSSYGRQIDNASPRKEAEIAVAKALESEHVSAAVTGYWYGSSMKLWSQSSLTYAVVAECNKPSPLNTRREWYKPSDTTKRSALVIDMSDGDLAFLGYCKGTDLERIYGTPIKTLQVDTGPKPGLDKYVNIWIYDYDVRSRLQPIDIN